MSFSGSCEVELGIEYAPFGPTVPLCWEPRCWVVVYAGAPPVSPCGSRKFAGPEPPAALHSVTLVYDPNALYCVRGVAGPTAVPAGRDDRRPCKVPRPCLPRGLPPVSGPAGLVLGVFDGNLRPMWTHVCGVTVVRPPQPVVPAPLADRDIVTAVLGVKLVKPPPHVFPLRPGIGTWVRDEFMALDDPGRGARASGIDAAPPEHAASAAGVPLGTTVAAAALLGLAVLTVSALRVLLRAPGAHRATRLST